MKSAFVILAEGFEEIEALTVVDVLRRANIHCDTCSFKEQFVTGSHNITVKADKILEDDMLSSYDLLVLPGGMPGARNLKDNPQVIKLVKEYNNKGKYIAALCAAPIVLDEAGIIEGKDVTSYPAFKEQLRNCSYREEVVVESDNIITSRGPATALPFALKLVELLCSKAESDNLKEGMMMKFLEDKIKESI